MVKTAAPAPDPGARKDASDKLIDGPCCANDCPSCADEELAVTCGSVLEAKQYEYNIKDHKTHASMGHDMAGAAHIEHEAAMTNPAMAKQMEADMAPTVLYLALAGRPDGPLFTGGCCPRFASAYAHPGKLAVVHPDHARCF